MNIAVEHCLTASIRPLALLSLTSGIPTQSSLGCISIWCGSSFWVLSLRKPSYNQWVIFDSHWESDILTVSQSLIYPIIVVSYDRRWPIETPLNECSFAGATTPFQYQQVPLSFHGCTSVIIFCLIFCSLEILWVSCFAFAVSSYLPTLHARHHYRTVCIDAWGVSGT